MCLCKRPKALYYATVYTHLTYGVEAWLVLEKNQFTKWKLLKNGDTDNRFWALLGTYYF